MTMDAAVSSNSTNEPSPGDIAHASVVIILGILVCFCSFLTILVVHKFRSVSNPDLLILALAIIDFISSITVFPLAGYWYLRTGAYPNELCLIYGALTTTIQLASTMVVSLMTVDRFLAIRKPILYRTRVGSLQLKRIIGIVVIISIFIGSLPAALSTTTLTSMTNRHGYCTFRYSSNFAFVILAISLPQIPLIVYCYYGFLVSIQKFIKRRQPHQVPSPASSTVSSEIGRRNNAASLATSTSGAGLGTWISRCHIYCCCCCCCCGVCRTKQREAATREEVADRAQTMMKNLNLKRCTRMSKTVALVVVIYYVPWLLALITMIIELITKIDDYSSTLNLVMVRLMMAHSIFYPVVYATFCGYYKQAYKWALSLPFHPCGVEWHERQPLGLTVSEMHRISHQMALEEWESPGLNRRLYSKRPYLKRSISLKDAANVESDAGHENPAFDRNEITSSDQNAEDGLITVEIVNENTGRKASIENLAPSVSVHQIVPTDSPQLPQRPRMQNEKKRGTSAPRRPLENQTSDSGVDVDSIHMDSAHSGSNSPAVCRLQTVESESSTSVSDVTEHLVRADDVRDKETSFVLENNHEDNLKLTFEMPKISGIEVNDCGEQSESKNVRLKYIKQIGLDIETDDVITEHDDVKPRDTAEKSTITESNGYSIKETSPGKNSILRIEPCSAGDHCQGLVRIHVEVIELSPDSPPLASDICSLQSKTRQCRVRSAHQKPSLKFNMQKNRFVPSTSSFEEMDSYSLDLGGQSGDTASETMTTPKLNLTDADGTLTNGVTSNGETANDTTATTGDIDESKLSNDPSAKGFKNRRMRASRALRESARYDDDIVRFSEMIMRRQNEDKLSGDLAEPKETEPLGSLPVPGGS